MGQTTSSLQPPEGLEAVTLADVRRAVVVHRKRLGGAVLLSARQAQQLLQPKAEGDEARAVEAAIKRWFGGWFKGPDGRTVDRVGGNLVLGALACVAKGDATPGDEGAVRARATALFAVLAAGATHLDSDHVALRLDGASRALARVETGGKRCREDGERHFKELCASAFGGQEVDARTFTVAAEELMETTPFEEVMLLRASSEAPPTSPEHALNALELPDEGPAEPHVRRKLRHSREFDRPDDEETAETEDMRLTEEAFLSAPQPVEPSRSQRSSRPSLQDVDELPERSPKASPRPPINVVDLTAPAPAPFDGGTALADAAAAPAPAASVQVSKAAAPPVDDDDDDDGAAELAAAQEAAAQRKAEKAQKKAEREAAAKALADEASADEDDDDGAAELAAAQEAAAKRKAEKEALKAQKKAEREAAAKALADEASAEDEDDDDGAAELAAAQEAAAKRKAEKEALKAQKKAEREAAAKALADEASEEDEDDGADELAAAQEAAAKRKAEKEALKAQKKAEREAAAKALADEASADEDDDDDGAAELAAAQEAAAKRKAEKEALKAQKKAEREAALKAAAADEPSEESDDDGADAELAAAQEAAAKKKAEREAAKAEARAKKQAEREAALKAMEAEPSDDEPDDDGADAELEAAREAAAKKKAERDAAKAEARAKKEAEREAARKALEDAEAESPEEESDDDSQASADAIARAKEAKARRKEARSRQRQREKEERMKALKEAEASSDETPRDDAAEKEELETLRRAKEAKQKRSAEKAKRKQFELEQRRLARERELQQVSEDEDDDGISPRTKAAEEAAEEELRQAKIKAAERRAARKKDKEAALQKRREERQKELEEALKDDWTPRPEDDDDFERQLAEAKAKKEQRRQARQRQREEANRRALAEAARDSPRMDPGPKPVHKDGRTHEMLEGEAPGLPADPDEYCLPAPDTDDYALPPAPAYDPDIDGATNWNWKDQDAHGSKYQRGFRAYQNYKPRPPSVPGSKPENYETDMRSLGSGDDSQSLGSAQMRTRKAMFPPHDGDHWQEEWQEGSMASDTGLSPPKRVYDYEADLGHQRSGPMEPDPEGLEGGPYRRFGPRPMPPPELPIPNGASRPVPEDLGYRPRASDSAYGVLEHVDEARHASERAGDVARQAADYERKRPASPIFCEAMIGDNRDDVERYVGEAKEASRRASTYAREAVMAGESREQFTPSRTDEAYGVDRLVPSVAPRARPEQSLPDWAGGSEQLGLSGHEKTDLGPRSPMEPYQAADPYSSRSPQQRTELDDAHGGGYGEAWHGEDAYGNDPDFEGGKYQRGFQAMSEKGIDSIAGAFSHFSGRQAQGGFSTTPGTGKRAVDFDVGPSPPFDGGYGGAMGGSGGSGGRFQLDRSQSMHAENWQGQDAYGNDPDYEGGKYERGARGFGMDIDGGVGESKFDGGFDGGPFGGSGGSGGGFGGSGGPFGGSGGFGGSGEYKHDPDAYGAEVNERPEGGYFGHANAVNSGGFGGSGGPFGGSGGFGGNADAPPPPGRRFQLDRSQSAHAENWTGQDAYGNDPDYEGSKFERGAQGFHVPTMQQPANEYGHHRREPTQSSSPLQDDDMSRVSQISDPYSPVPIRDKFGNDADFAGGKYQRGAQGFRSWERSLDPLPLPPEDGSLAPYKPRTAAELDEMSTHTPMRGGAVYEEKGQLHQVGGGVGKLNIRAWTSSDAAVLREVPSVLCVGFGDGVDFSLQTNVKAAAIALEVISSPDYLGAQVVFWDGAELRHDSYTSVLPALAARGCKLAAWRAGASEAQKKLLASSWACVDACDAVVALFDDKSPRVGETVAGAPPQPRHASKAALNCLKLIHYAGVSRVVCFGGGQDVLDLVDNAPGHVEFHVIPAVRCADNGADGVFGTDDDEFEEAHVLAYGGKNAQRVHVYQLNG